MPIAVCRANRSKMGICYTLCMSPDAVVIDAETGKVDPKDRGFTPPPLDTTQRTEQSLKQEQGGNQILQQFVTPTIQELIDTRNHRIASARDFFAGSPLAASVAESGITQQQLEIDLTVAREIARRVGIDPNTPFVAPLGPRNMSPSMDTAFIDGTRLGIFQAINNNVYVALSLKPDQHGGHKVVVFPKHDDPLTLARNAVAALASKADILLTPR